MHDFCNAAGIGRQCWRGTREDGGGVEELTLRRTLRDRSTLRCAGVIQVGEVEGEVSGGRMRCCNRDSDLCKFEGKEGVDIGG